MPVRTALSVWPLFLGLSLIGLAVGVQGSLLGVRAELEGFEDFLIGLLMSCYFAGFLGGSMLAPRIIERVGHIRIFGFSQRCRDADNDHIAFAKPAEICRRR